MGEKKIAVGKNVIVTGSARGIGRQIADTLAANGANVFAHARQKSEEHESFCRKAAETYGVRVLPIYFDLRDPEEIKNGIKEIRSWKIPINGLVNNAGISYRGLVQMTDIAEMHRVFEINYFAPYLLTQYVVKLMVREKSGSIVNISSSSALDANPGLSAYASSKAALLCMTKCLAAEVGTMGIRANVICPGVTDTGMISEMHDYIFNIQKEAACLKKIAVPTDIANTALFLISDYSSYITGQVLKVDGGVAEYRKRQ